MQPSPDQAFLDLTERLLPRFRRIAASYSRGRDAEDLLQEILFQLWRSLPAFRGDASPDTFAYRVALNTALTFRRGRAPDLETLPDDGALPLHRAMSAGEPGDLSSVLEDFLASLGRVDRAVLLLHLDDLDHAAIASITGSSENAVAIRLTRIRKQFEHRYLED